MKNRKLVVAASLAAAAAVFAGWSGWNWLAASNDPSLAYVNAREDALRAGRTQVATLNTLDYHDIPGGIERWLAASTGPLHDQLAHTDQQSKQDLAKGATVATGKVLDAAISELDERAGTAKLLASVEITVAKAGVAPGTKRDRFAAQLTRTDGGWKLSALDQVPVGSR